MKNSKLVVPAYINGEFGRRTFLRGAAIGTTGLSAALFFGCGGSSKDPKALPAAGEEPPPEISTIKLMRAYELCPSPMYLASDFLKEEGFADVQYIPLAKRSDIVPAIADGTVDVSVNFAPVFTTAIDSGASIVSLGGIHVGCYEIFARPGIESVRDLKGRTVALAQSNPTPPDYEYMATLLSALGVTRDMRLKAFPSHEMANVLLNGEADAIIATPPLTQLLRTLGVGNVILNSNTDTPWSNYVCCLVGARPDFITKNPVATKRALRAIYNATDLAANDPESAADRLVGGGFAVNREYALETLALGKYGTWRDYDPEASLRFYALRLKEEGVISATPDEIIDGHTDWRFLDMLKKEMAYFPPPPKDRSAFAISCGPDGVPYGPLQQS